MSQQHSHQRLQGDAAPELQGLPASMPATHQGRPGGSPLQQMPPPQRAGGSPLMDQDAWMVQMLGAVPAANSPGAAGGNGAQPGGRSHRANRRAARQAAKWDGQPPPPQQQQPTGYVMPGDAMGAAWGQDPSAAGAATWGEPGAAFGSPMRMPPAPASAQQQQQQQQRSGSSPDGATPTADGNGTGTGGGSRRGRRGRGGSRQAGAAPPSEGPMSVSVGTATNPRADFTRQALEPLAPDADRSYAVVEFKRKRFKKFEARVNVGVAQYVLVDGDRGQDCGLVVALVKYDASGSEKVTVMDGCDIAHRKVKLDDGQILRVAQAQEVELLHNQIAALEQQALNACRLRAQELGITINVVDCEYQFDGKKISFFFDSDTSIDFRDLVKDLYRMFNARIWMENINGKVKNTVPPGALSYQQKVALGKKALAPS